MENKRDSGTILADLERRRRDAIRRSFMRVDALAMGTAFGVTAALLLGVVTARMLVTKTSDDLEYNVGLLTQYLRGFDITWSGLFCGMAWALGLGFVVGFVVAGFRNLALHFVLWKLNWDQARFRRRHFLDEI